MFHLTDTRLHTPCEMPYRREHLTVNQGVTLPAGSMSSQIRPVNVTNSGEQSNGHRLKPLKFKSFSYFDEPDHLLFLSLKTISVAHNHRFIKELLKNNYLMI